MIDAFWPQWFSSLLHVTKTKRVICTTLSPFPIHNIQWGDREKITAIGNPFKEQEAYNSYCVVAILKYSQASLCLLLFQGLLPYQDPVLLHECFSSPLCFTALGSALWEVLFSFSVRNGWVGFSSCFLPIQNWIPESSFVFEVSLSLWSSKLI